MQKIISLVQNSPFLRHNAVFFVGSLGVATLNYLYYPVLGRVMEPARFGEVQAILSIFLQAAIFLSIMTYVAVYVTVNADNAAERSRGLLALEHVALIAGGITLGICLLFVGVLRDFFHFVSVWPFVALFVALFVSIPLNLRMAYLRGRKLYMRSSMTDGIGSATKLVLSPALVYVGLSTFGAVLGLTISQVVSLCIGTWWAYQAGLKGFGLRRRHMDFGVLRPQVRYAAAVFVASVSVTVAMSIDVLAIKHYFDPGSAGVYAGMAAVGRIVFFLTTPFTAVLLTMVKANAPPEKNQQWLKGALALTVGIGGAAVMVLSVGASFFVRLLVGSSYLTYAHLLPQLCLAMLLIGIANLLLLYHVALRRFWFAILPLTVTFFTLILVGVRHNTIAQIVNDVLISGCVLVTITVGTTWLRMIRERSGG